MCDPLTIAGMALSAGSTLMQQNQQASNMQRMAAARNAATEENFARQDSFIEESKNQFGETLQKFRPGEQSRRETDAQAGRAALADRAIKQTGDYLPSAKSGPDIVGKNVARQLSQANDRAAATAGRGARVAGFGDVLFDNKIDLGHGRDQLAETSNLSRGTASLLPLEQDAASRNAYKAPGPFSNLVKLAGTGATLAGVGGLGPSWKDIFGGPGVLGVNNSAWGPGFFQALA